MFSKLSPISILRSLLWIFVKKMLVRNMWKVYTRPTSASDFFTLYRVNLFFFNQKSKEYDELHHFPMYIIGQFVDF
jgi:hypothetical protein